MKPSKELARGIAEIPDFQIKSITNYLDWIEGEKLESMKTCTPDELLGRQKAVLAVAEIKKLILQAPEYMKAYNKQRNT